MDGKEALYQLRHLLGEGAESGFLDDRISYQYINNAAEEFVSRTECLTGTQTLTTVADQVGYTLNADFVEVYLRDRDNRLRLPYNDGSSSYNDFIYFKGYNEIIMANNIASVSKPDSFAVIDDSTLDSRLSGTATGAGASSGGECTLTDSAADFSDVSPGDIVHNTTDGSDGVVISKTSSTVLVTALFNGTDGDWTSSDAYVIQPQGRLQLVFDPPPSSGGHTATVHYIKRPEPVYSDYGMFRFQSQHMQAILKYAAFNYKYRDQDPNFGDAYFQHWDREVRRAANNTGKSLNKEKLVVNFKGRRCGNKSTYR